MSLEVYPPIPAHELKLKVDESLEQELQWVIDETLQICQDLKHGLEDCYALLAPIDPGSTLAMVTSRSEMVKGTLTRVGTRIVKGRLNLQLRTTGNPREGFDIAPNHDVHIPALENLHQTLTQSIDLLGQTLSSTPPATTLASTLSLLSTAIADATTCLKGPSSSGPSSDPPISSWQTSSCPPTVFSPQLPPNLSFHLSVKDCCIVLHIRALEPVDAPVHIGFKLGLALGTVRRLEHDEMETVFRYDPTGRSGASESRHLTEANRTGSVKGSKGGPAAGAAGRFEEVYVREKVQVEAADPNLISLHSKLGYLSHMLGQARTNLAAVMATDIIE